jgi:hypothetical protein
MRISKSEGIDKPKMIIKATKNIKPTMKAKPSKQKMTKMATPVRKTATMQHPNALPKSLPGPGTPRVSAQYHTATIPKKK